MVGILAIAAAAAWLLAFGWCAAASRQPALRAGGAAGAGRGLAAEKPALVNLSAARCRLNGAAYPATILDLAARGYLAVTGRVPGQLWCEVPAATPSGAGLARSERLVLAGVRALAGGEGAPFEALAESCASDVRGRWDPFERAVRAEGRRAGITRPRLPASVRVLLYAGAGLVSALTFAAIHGRPHPGLWAPLAAAFFAFVAPAYWARSLGRQDRLTGQGSALGAWAARVAGDMAAAQAAAGGAPGAATGPQSAGLSRLAWAVAAGVPVPLAGAVPGHATGVLPGRGRAAARTGISGQFAGTSRPAAAWSSVGGQWRMVRIGPTSFLRMHWAFWLVLAAWLAPMAYVCSLLPGPAGILLAAALAAGSAAAVAGGVRGLTTWLARPAETSFQGQVIARWAEHRRADDDSCVPCIAVDDGERCWSFDISGMTSGQLALGDTVAVRASPRSGKLLGLTPGQSGTGDRAAAPGRPGMGPAAVGPPAVGPAAPGRPGMGAADAATGEAVRGLLTAAEVSAAAGRAVRATGFAARAAGAVYRGEGVTVIVTVADGFLGSLSSLARRRGQPLPGVGDEAWLLNRGRTVVLRAGGLTAKVTVGGPAARSLPPDVATRLAATVAGRLPHQAPSPGPPG